MAIEKDSIGEETVQSLGNIAQGFSLCVSPLLGSSQQIEHLRGPVPSTTQMLTQNTYNAVSPLRRPQTEMLAEKQRLEILEDRDSPVFILKPTIQDGKGHLEGVCLPGG